jgi:transposase
MRPHGSCEELEERRCLAIARVLDGYDVEEVANFLDVEARSVYRWLASFRQTGNAGLQAVPPPGRPPKLTLRQADQVLDWLTRDPLQFGFATSRWTAPRLAIVIDRRLGVQLHPRYLNAWLREHGVSPQIPACVARERDPEAIEGWVRYKWPRIKRGPKSGVPPLFSTTKAAFS